MRWAAFCLLAVPITACGTAAPPPPVIIITATSAVPSPAGVVSGPAALKGSSAVDASPACVASLRPSGSLPAPGHMPAGSTMAAIYRRGFLIVGVDQTTPLLSYRDPATGRVDGFNVAIARQVAKAIFGDENAIKPVAITSAQRKSAIESHQVDLIADPTTINCDRLAWADFSTDYLDAHQRVLVPSASKARGIGDLGGQKVCAAAGSPGYGHATAAGSAATAWYAVHRSVRGLDNGGDYPAAVHLAIGSGAAAFQHVEADLAGGIRAGRASFTAAASRGDDALGGLVAGMGIASLLMAAGCAGGLTRRIAEYH